MSDALDRLEKAGLELWPPLKQEWAATIATVRQELQRLRGGISVRDALVTENVIRAAAAEAEVERLREGLREALAIIENSREFGLPLNVPVVDVVVERGRALLADSPDGGGAK